MAKQIKLDLDEKITLLIRKHFLPFIFEVLFLVVLIVFPPVLFFSGRFIDSLSFLSDYSVLFIFGYSIIILFVWISFFIAWTNYYLDVLVVTNKRVIDIEQKRFFHRDIATLSLDKIEDIKVEIKGFLATLLNYGSLNLQTAAESREFVIHNIPQPIKAKDQIWNLHVDAIQAPQDVRIIQNE